MQLVLLHAQVMRPIGIYIYLYIYIYRERERGTVEESQDRRSELMAFSQCATSFSICNGEALSTYA